MSCYPHRSQGKRLSDDDAVADGAVGVTGRGRGPPGRRLSALPLQMQQHQGLGPGLGGGLERQDSHGAGPDAADGEEHSTHEIAAFLDAQRRQRLREESIQVGQREPLEGGPLHLAQILHFDSVQLQGRSYSPRFAPGGCPVGPTSS